ncbi:MAG: hypothetical protein ABR964_03395 [Tepidisphaeraceae bacterium]|jgi:hypothetical protein
MADVQAELPSGVSVVVPVYNSEGGLELLASRLRVKLNIGFDVVYGVQYATPSHPYYCNRA